MPTATTNFDPTTAYRTDWQYMDGVEDGTLLVRQPNAEVDESYDVKLLRADTSRPDLQRLGIGVNFSPNETVWFLWLVYPTLATDPAPPAPRGGDGGGGDALELTVDGEVQHWMIQTVHESRVGSLYVLGCVKGRVNAD